MKTFIQLTVMAGESGGGMFSGITSFLNKLPGELKALGLILAVICAMFLGFCLMGGGGQAIQRHKGWAISICAGIILICIAPTLVPAIAGAVGG